MEQWLNRRLWGYPYFVDIVFSELADVRSQALMELEAQQIAGQVATSKSKKETPPAPHPVLSTVVWAHAEANDVNPVFMKEGPDWYALFNPDMERSLDVDLVHTFKQSKYVSIHHQRVGRSFENLFALRAV